MGTKIKKSKPNPKANRNLMVVTYIVLCAFVGLVVYFACFLQLKRDQVINHSYNARLDHFSERMIRGAILSNDGQILAKTQVDEAGRETRSYPLGNLFAHVVGHTSKGKTGLENQANFYLLSSHEPAAEQLLNQLMDRKSQGDDVVTTLDVGLQQIAYEALGDRRGAVVAMEPDSGKILAMVSKPDYDPNPDSLDQQWAELIREDNQAAQLLNRATQGLYPPGSVFKIITLLEYIRENPETYGEYHFDCDGVYRRDSYTIKCYHGNAHGQQDVGQAFANSCNGAFANLGLTLDLAKMQETADALYFNQELPLEMVYSKSVFPMAEGADEWEILQTSIGQGKTQVTPVHMAMITAAAANGGMLMKPYLIDHIQNASGQEGKKFLPEALDSLMSAEESRKLNEEMVKVVAQGTGSALRGAPYQAAGKTGSAEFEKNKETHAWFTGYAPAEDPQIVVTVIVEEGGSGGAVAAPVARQMFDYYLMK